MTQLFQYAIVEQHIFPVTNIIGTVKLEAIDEQSTNLLWDVQFDIADEHQFPPIKEGIEGLYAMGAQGLEALVKKVAA